MKKAFQKENTVYTRCYLSTLSNVFGEPEMDYFYWSENLRERWMLPKSPVGNEAGIYSFISLIRKPEQRQADQGLCGNWANACLILHWPSPSRA